jgi:hypothetical protein
VSESDRTWVRVDFQIMSLKQWAPLHDIHPSLSNTDCGDLERRIARLGQWTATAGWKW